jgi:hypothetical protein
MGVENGKVSPHPSQTAWETLFYSSWGSRSAVGFAWKGRRNGDRDALGRRGRCRDEGRGTFRSGKGWWLAVWQTGEDLLMSYKYALLKKKKNPGRKSKQKLAGSRWGTAGGSFIHRYPLLFTGTGVMGSETSSLPPGRGRGKTSQSLRGLTFLLN